jgi:hypothetical protein
MSQSRRYASFWSACALAAWLSLAPNAVAESIDDLGGWLAAFAQGDLQSEECPQSASFPQATLCPQTTLGPQSDASPQHPFKWWFDGHVRLLDDSDGFGQSIARPGVGYELSEGVVAWIGYAWIHTSPGAGPKTDEHRIWQQLTWGKQLDTAKLDLRARLEQRFVETGSDTGWRFRQLAALRRPFQADPRFTFVAWDEVFFHLNDVDWGARDGFDQNRVFVGFGWKPNLESTWRIETGYVHQFVDRRGQDDLSNHILSINLFWNP